MYIPDMYILRTREDYTGVYYKNIYYTSVYYKSIYYKSVYNTSITRIIESNPCKIDSKLHLPLLAAKLPLFPGNIKQCPRKL